MPDHLISADPFILNIPDGIDTSSGVPTVDLVSDVPPGDGDYLRTSDGWRRVEDDEFSVSGSGTGNIILASYTYDENSGPDFFDVNVRMVLDSNSGNSGFVSCRGTASRGTGSVSESHIRERADNIPRTQSVRLFSSGDTLSVVLRLGPLSVSYKATIKRKVWQ